MRKLQKRSLNLPEVGSRGLRKDAVSIHKSAKEIAWADIEAAASYAADLDKMTSGG